MTHSRTSLIISVLCALALLAVPAAASATPRHSAKQALRLTDQRLSYMRGVMASKWSTRSPIEAQAQEAAVLAGARDAAVKRGLSPRGVTRLFSQEIALAKTVELGWGNEWLLHGFPATQPIPDLNEVRAKLAALSPKIIDALAGLGNLRCNPHVRAQLLRDSHRLIRTPYVTNRDRTRIVDRILAVHESAAPQCGD